MEAYFFNIMNIFDIIKLTYVFILFIRTDAL